MAMVTRRGKGSVVQTPFIDSFKDEVETKDVLTIEADEPMEPDIQEEVMEDVSETGQVKRKKSNTRAMRNKRIKNYIHPKNSVMCLNELRNDLEYNVKQDQQHPFLASVVVDGIRYEGHGSSKALAKQAAAESALISFVKSPETDTDEDPTPWATIASFAMYKLFNQWKEMKGSNAHVASAGLNYGSAVAPQVNFIKSQLEQKPEAQNTTSIVPKPAKSLPEGAHAMHPVMVLHQMCPSIQYDTTQAMMEGKNHFLVGATVFDKQFRGEGSTLKKAKISLAVSALQELYGVKSEFVQL